MCIRDSDCSVRQDVADLGQRLLTGLHASLLGEAQKSVLYGFSAELGRIQQTLDADLLEKAFCDARSKSAEEGLLSRCLLYTSRCV